MRRWAQETAHLFLNNSLAFLEQPGSSTSIPRRESSICVPRSARSIEQMKVELPRLQYLLAIGGTYERPLRDLDVSRHPFFVHELDGAVFERRIRRSAERGFSERRIDREAARCASELRVGLPRVRNAAQRLVADAGRRAGLCRRARGVRSGRVCASRPDRIGHRQQRRRACHGRRSWRAFDRSQTQRVHRSRRRCDPRGRHQPGCASSVRGRKWPTAICSSSTTESRP